MSTQNRLSLEQLVALQPKDPVVVETAGDFQRPTWCTGSVVRITGTHIVVSVRSSRGVPYVHRFGRRDGACIEGARRRELVDPDATPVVSTQAATQQAGRIDALYREWRRTRDADNLRQLHAAIGEHLAVELADA